MSIWQPDYEITPAIAGKLIEIEANRATVDSAPLSPVARLELARSARVRATHYSTRIEGNRLTLEEAGDVISRRRRQFHGRERDVAEVRNYWAALVQVEKWAREGRPLTEETVRRIHGVVMNGNRARLLAYREGQNVIRDSVSGGIIYLPPEARDVPGLMREMVSWVNHAEKSGLPAVITAGLAHYQFVTIHPYYDGNGRTARLLATLVLHKGGYGLGGMFSLEEHHARDLAAYYAALDIGGHHNYYMGRADADLTPWLGYFVGTLADVFAAAVGEVRHRLAEGPVGEPEELRALDHRARTVLALFADRDVVSTSDVAGNLGLSDRMARVLLRQWVDDGWLLVANPSNRGRAYGLAPRYRDLLRR